MTSQLQQQIFPLQPSDPDNQPTAIPIQVPQEVPNGAC